MNNFYALVLFSALFGAIDAGFIDPFLRSKIGRGGHYDVILELPPVIHDVEKSPLLQKLSGDAKVSALVASLQELTSVSQASYRKQATSLRIEFESFWASNIILLKNIDARALSVFAEIEGNFQLREPHTVSLPSVEEVRDNSAPRQQVQWNVEQVRAPEAWLITQGEGAVVGTIDTGVNIGHEAFRDNFAGAWSDPYYNATTPDDTNGHGSHTLGIIVGQTNGISVAPGARWVACRGMNNQGSGTEAVLTLCAQFMITANPRPHVVNNAWGGGPGQTWFNSHISAWKLAGIVPVFGSGASGPTCSSVGSPGDVADALQVGRTIASDELFERSSRGPSFEGLIKPDLVAPGVNLVSAGTGTDNYVTMSGSGANSHVSGVVALVVSANPDLSVDEIFDILRSSAFQPEISSPDDEFCGPGPDVFPNNAYGYGRVDAAAAVALARK